GGLLVHPGRAVARRVLRVALDLRGASLMALGEDARGEPVELHAGGVITEDPGDHVAGCLDIRNDLVRVAAPAAGDAGERHARADELQPRSAARAVRP